MAAGNDGEKIDQDHYSYVNHNDNDEQLEQHHGGSLHNNACHSSLNNHNVGLQARFNNAAFQRGECSNRTVIHQQLESPVRFTSVKSTSTANGVEEYQDHSSQNKETRHQVQNVRLPISSYNIILDPQKEGPIGLTLSMQTVIDLLEPTSPKETQQSGHQELMLSQPQPEKMKASNVPAIRLTIGSWQWVSKHEGDLAVKFYFGKKKIVWEFLFGSLKKKIEIRWTQVTAINTFVDEDKTCRLEIELNEPPEKFNEVKYQAKKHTQWEATLDDFTDGQAPICRRHTVIFPPGVLDEPFDKLLQCDSRLLNLSQQPFPTHNSPLFQNQILDFSCNKSVPGCSSVPAVNNDYRRAMVPYVQNVVPPISSFAGHYGPSLPEPVLNSAYLAHDVEVPYGDQVWDQQAGNDTLQEIPVTPIGAQDYILPSEEMEPWATDDMDSQVADKSPIKETSFTFDTTLNPEIVNMVNQPYINNEIVFPDAGSWSGFDAGFGMDFSSGRLPYVDNDLPNIQFDFQEQSSWQPFEYSMQQFSNVGNEVNQMELAGNGLHKVDQNQ